MSMGAELAGHVEGIRFTVNDQPVEALSDPATRLTSVLREELALKGTKVGCDAGDCGACTVLIDGAPVCACMTAVAQVAGRSVTTVEGLARDGTMSRLQRSFLDHGAAQCGICTPGMLVAATALLNAVKQPSETQVQDALGGVLCRCTGYRRIIDAVMDAGTRIESRGKGVGAAIPRLDGVPKVLGTDRFGDDVSPHDALLVRVIRSPFHRARFGIGDLDAFVAATPGLVAAFTARDIPGQNLFGVIPPFADQPVFAHGGETRFRGEAVAALVGEREALQDLDLAAVPVSWTELDPTMTTETAKTSEPMHQSRPGNVLVEGFVARGDIDAALTGAAHVVGDSFTTAFVEHGYIEPEAGTAFIRDDGRIEIQACTQAPHMDREAVAAIMGVPEDQIVVTPTAVGGGFGSKIDVSIQPILALAARITGRPCRICYTRPESMRSTTKRHPARMTVNVGADAQGKLMGLRFEGDFDTGAYASWGPTVANRVPVHASGPYNIPAYRARAVALHTNGPVSGAFRGFGVPQAAIAQETLFDRLADACGIDRLEFRLRNALLDGQPTVTGQHFDTGVGIHACLTALQEPWARARTAAAQWNRDNPASPLRRGVGLGTCWYGCGNTSLPNPSTIKAGLRVDGTVRLHQGAVDIGQGSNTVITQIFAEALGVAATDVEMFVGNSDVTPDAGKTSASRQTFVSGKAAMLAGLALREALLRHGNVSDAAEITLTGGKVVLRDGGAERRLDPATLPVDAEGFVFRVAETYDPPTAPLDENGQGEPYALYGYGAQMVELEVDSELGTVKLRHITAAHDVGRAINPQLVQGQIEGGIAQGVGMALMEDYQPGRTENLHDYLIPTIGDIPEIESIIIEVPDAEGPYGAKGLGEHVLIPTAPAILNAIRDATGAIVTTTPATPDRILTAIRAARRTAND
ncbi:MAG: molybdopterin-dependent oxidoreductase [Minwuia sp.]|nr:molybdopterin-dependent oxidoreductase [Minwuia sp.]